MDHESPWIALLNNPDALMLLAAYFIPTWIAVLRRSAAWGTCFWINLVFGWTLIGWVIAIGLAAVPTKSQLAHRAKVAQARDDFYLREAEKAKSQAG